MVNKNSSTLNSSSPFKAAFYRNPNDLILKDICFDKVMPGEQVIQVDACGICGTDVNAAVLGTDCYTVFGHEIAGRVLDQDGNLGEPVVLESASACGRCASCRNGRSDFCTDVKSFFARPYLGMAERMVTPNISVLPYCDLDPAVATLSEPLGVAIDLCEVADITPYSTVLVVGLGPIGLMALKIAKLSGAARIYASSFSNERLRNQLALEFGADELLYEDQQTLATRKLNPAPDRILITAPPPVIRGCVTPAAPGAILAYLGVGHGETDRIELAANEFHFKKLQLRASYASPALRTPMALELLRSGRIDGAKLISHRFPFSEAAEALRTACLRDKAIKVVVEMNAK
jgi:threonine dehydrogenase-like Zn-dependent dehydrogenase